MWRSFSPLIGLVPALILLAAVYFDRWRDKRRGARLPVTEKLLRPPGHSLTVKIEEVADQVMIWMFTGAVGAVLAAGFSSGLPTASLTLFAIGGTAAVACTLVAWRKAVELRNLRLGLLGEQVVAEQLHALASKGFAVFHDVPGSDKWNIDHVAVGPTGVFAIETKARTKRPGPAGQPAQEVKFDGKALYFPTCTEAKPLEQARRNARWLAGTLSKAIAEPVTVQPVVVLPGWFVRRQTGNAEVGVLNEKELPGFISKRRAIISEQTAQRISWQLDQRCRDVTF